MVPRPGAVALPDGQHQTHLCHAGGQLSEEGRRGFEHRAAVFIDRLAAKLRSSHLLPDIGPHKFGSLVWTVLHGCHLLSDAMGDSVADRLPDSWMVLLRGAIPPIHCRISSNS